MKFKYNNKEYELVMLCLTGSRLYGNNREDSDWDYRGVFIAPLEDKVGMFGTINQIENSKELNELFKKEFGNKFHESDDIVLYEITNFFKLAADNNPNIIDILYSPKEANIYYTNIWYEIQKNINLFLSKKTKFTFSGYAFSQLHRLEGHNKWLTQYPAIGKVYENIKEAWKKHYIDFNYVKDHFSGELAKVLQDEFGKNEEFDYCAFEDSNFYPSEEYLKPHIINYCSIRKMFNKKNYEITDSIKYNLFYRTAYEKFTDTVFYIYKNEKYKGIFSPDGNIKSVEIDSINLDEDDLYCILKVNRTEYEIACKKYEQLWNWKINRNKERGKIEDLVGYDTKHASHLFRLLLKANEILKTKTYNPVLTESEKIIINNIKQGKLSYEEMLKQANELNNNLEELYKITELQNEPKRNKINELLLSILFLYDKININGECK